MKNCGPLVWIDCEMTGLDVNNDHILQVCCLLTDRNLDLIDNGGFEEVVHYPKEVLDKMNQWCITNHTKSGLVDKVLNSTNTAENVQSGLLEYIKKYIKKPQTGVLAGNSVHMDRYFMMREFPDVVNYLSHRQVDVSTINEIGKRHNPRLMMQLPEKKYKHTARDDILESIQELRWYYKYYLVPNKIETAKKKL